jgi:hypothetical protein
MENLGLNGAPWWRLGARTRKGVLVVHIVSAGAWIGIDVVMGVLVFTALLAANEGARALCYRALELVVFALRLGVIEMAEQGRRFMAGEPASLAVGGLIFPPIVSASALLVATVLAVFKPWGRIRKRQSSKPDAR